MKVSNVSSQAITQALRYSLGRMQADLVTGQKEVASGRVADVGLTLGVRTGQAVTLTRDIERLTSLKDSNELVSARLSATQNGMSQLSGAAETFLSSLTAAVSGSADPEVTQQSASALLDTLTGILNSSFNGEHIFAGINTDVRPITDYQADGSPNKAAFDASFLAEFGFSQGAAAAENITDAEIRTFIDGAVSNQFLGAGWAASWSSASDQTIVTRISLNETAETSISANNDGVRKLAMAATLVADLFGSELNGNTLIAVAERATQLVGEALADLSDAQSKAGIAQERIEKATERIDVQVGIFTDFLNDLEGVDPYEAATKVNALITQIETSYALTSRIQQLSLMRYLT